MTWTLRGLYSMLCIITKQKNRIKEEQNHETDREDEKKNLAILGGVLIGIGLIAAIGMQFGSKPSGEDVLPGTGETETELIVDPGDFEKKEEEK